MIGKVEILIDVTDRRKSCVFGELEKDSNPDFWCYMFKDPSCAECMQYHKDTTK